MDVVYGIGVRESGKHGDGDDIIKEHAFLGVVMCIVGGIVDNTGVTIQKLAHRNEKLSEKPYYRRPLWLVGKREGDGDRHREWGIGDGD